MKKLTKGEIEAIVLRHCLRTGTWGGLERLAGVDDRDAFWAGKDEAQARAALREIIKERVRRGELS